MFIYIQKELINFSQVYWVEKKNHVYSDSTTYVINLHFVGQIQQDNLRVLFETEAERDKAFNDLMRWIGTLNANNMIG
jgi:hypothetical protein